MDILREIQKLYSTFSLKEKNMADYIMNKSEEIKNINIVDFAKLVDASSATITRFSKKIGCESFVDMKMKLNSVKHIEKISDEEDEGIFSYVYNYYNEVIERTKYLIDKESILKLVNDIKKAKKIYIYGVGSSGFTANEMMQRLLRMGFNVQGITDSHMMIINSSIVSADDLVIGISISGETIEVIKALSICNKNNAKIYSITSIENSSITKYSDKNLLVYNSSFVDKGSFINTQFSVMYLVDLISMVLLKDTELSSKMQITINAIT